MKYRTPVAIRLQYPSGPNLKNVTRNCVSFQSIPFRAADSTVNPCQTLHRFSHARVVLFLYRHCHEASMQSIVQFCACRSSGSEENHTSRRLGVNFGRPMQMLSCTLLLPLLQSIPVRERQVPPSAILLCTVASLRQSTSRSAMRYWNTDRTS